MASKKTLNAGNLEALGAARLAALLIEISSGDAAAKRRLRLELAGTQGPAEVAREVRKRLATIARSRSFVEWQNQRALAGDLETQRRAIVEQIARHDPAEGLDLLWQFLALANPLFERCDDSNGTVIAVFHAACDDLGPVAGAAGAGPEALADRAFQALTENDYGQHDGLIATLAAALGEKGLERLKQRMVAFRDEPVPKVPDKERQVIGWGMGGPLYADELAARSRDSTVSLALMAIADIQGDVDAFIGQYDEKTRTVPAIAAEIAQRLLAAGRTQEAWAAIEASKPRRRGDRFDVELDDEWEDARIAVLEALGRGEEAQAARWSCFERALSASHLREHLKRLPDFDDMQAEERALDHAQRHKHLLQALSFLLSWPALGRAARLVTERAAELDGDRYEILTPAAEALAGKHPFAATLLLRAMIDFSLTRSRSSRYRHAARHLIECARLAPAIGDFGTAETHAAYAARLRREHKQKGGFWSLLP